MSGAPPGNETRATSEESITPSRSASLIYSASVCIRCTDAAVDEERAFEHAATTGCCGRATTGLGLRAERLSAAIGARLRLDGVPACVPVAPFRYSPLPYQAVLRGR